MPNNLNQGEKKKKTLKKKKHLKSEDKQQLSEKVININVKDLIYI